MNPARCGLCVAALMALHGCSDPAADKPRAEVAAPAPAAEPATPSQRPVPAEPAAPKPAAVAQQPSAAVGGGPLLFSQDGSAIGFTGSKVTGSESGGFAQFEGEITLAAGAPIESGQVSAVIQMDSLQTPNPRLAGHLKSDDFFLVAEHPTAKFESTDIVKEGGQYKVTGNLTLRGTTKAISFPADINRAGAGVQIKAEFAINRKDFGVVYAGMPDDLIRDDVVIKLSLTAR